MADGSATRRDRAHRGGTAHTEEGPHTPRRDSAHRGGTAHPIALDPIALDYYYYHHHHYYYYYW